MLSKIDHVGIAVQSIDETLPFYQDSLGMTCTGREEVAEQKVEVAFLEIGESRIELLQPTSPESPVARFLEKNGPGVHHIAYRTADLVEALSRLRSAGARLVDEVPRRGAHGSLIAFIHPKSSHGVLTELCQHAV